MADKTTQESGGTRDPDEIEAEIDQTREELGDTVAAVTEKADVKKQTKAKAADAKKKATAKKDAAKQKATATKEQVTDKVREVAPESTAAGVQQAQQRARRNPTPAIVGVAAFGAFILGWAMGRR